MELVTEFDNDFQLSRPICDQTNVVVLQLRALANDSASAHVVLHYIIFCLALLFLPSLVDKTGSISIEAHADSLISEEVSLREGIAKMKLELVCVQETKSLLRKQPHSLVIDRVCLGEHFMSRELRVEHVA